MCSNLSTIHGQHNNTKHIHVTVNHCRSDLPFSHPLYRFPAPFFLSLSRTHTHKDRPQLDICLLPKISMWKGLYAFKLEWNTGKAMCIFTSTMFPLSIITTTVTSSTTVTVITIIVTMCKMSKVLRNELKQKFLILFESVSV